MIKSEKPVKILILGFSVTAERGGYADIVKKLLIEKNIDVQICGVGGVNPLPLPFIFSEINKKFDYVFLEIATSIYGSKIVDWNIDGCNVIYDLFGVIKNSGAELALINLYRDDFKYKYHVFDMVLEALSYRLNIPLLDLGNGLVEKNGIDFCRALLRDLVHTNKEGSDFQAKAVCEFIIDVLKKGRTSNNIPSPDFVRRTIKFSDVCGKNDVENFSRSGLVVPYVKLPINDSFEFNIQSDVKICGISYLSGPFSGEIELNYIGGNRIDKIQTFDENCYYERFNFKKINTISCNKIVICQTSQIPTVKLKKSEFNNLPRIGKLIAIHYLCKNH